MNRVTLLGNVGKDTIEADLQSKIDEAKNPTTLKGKPW